MPVTQRGDMVRTNDIYFTHLVVYISETQRIMHSLILHRTQESRFFSWQDRNKRVYFTNRRWTGLCILILIFKDYIKKLFVRAKETQDNVSPS